MTLSDYKNFHEFFSHQAEIFGDNICLTNGDRPEVLYSFKDLNSIVTKVAIFLSSIGVKKGDRFAVITRNSPEFMFLYLASMKLGSLIMPLVIDLPPEGILRQVQRFGIKAIFFSDESRLSVEEAHRLDSRIMPQGLDIFGLKDSIKGISQETTLFDNVSLDDPGSFYFSSGTTGEPKGIPQSPRNLLSAAEALVGVYGFSPKDTQMGVLPCYHTALVTYGFWPSFFVGSNFILFERFHKTEFWKNLARHRVSFVEVVPTILSMLLYPPEVISSHDLTNLKFIGSGSAPLSPALHQKFEDTFGIKVANQYGLSETAPTHFNPPERNLRKEGSIGKSMANVEARVVDERGEEAPNMDPGEIAMRGDSVVAGYYNNPQATSEAYRNGWFYTGDLGYRDSDGFYFLSGRKKEMISRGGEKIYPNEVDNVLATCEGLKEAATVGIPDPVYGEEVASFVVLIDDSAASEESIKEHCARFLPAFKCPKKIFFIDEVPKTASGKIIRRKLLELYNQNQPHET